MNLKGDPALDGVLRPLSVGRLSPFDAALSKVSFSQGNLLKEG